MTFDIWLMVVVGSVAVLATLLALWLSRDPWWKAEYERTGKPVVCRSEDGKCWFVFAPDCLNAAEIASVPDLPKVNDPWPDDPKLRIHTLWFRTEDDKVWTVTAGCEPVGRPPKPEPPQIELIREDRDH